MSIDPLTSLRRYRPRPATTGRPSLLDDPRRYQQIVDDMIYALDRAAPVETAAEYARVRPKVVWDWLAKAAGHDTECECVYCRFGEVIKQAQAAKELALLADLDHSDNLRWQRKAWLLERTRQDKYALQTQHVRHSGSIEVRASKRILHGSEVIDAEYAPVADDDPQSL